MALREFLTTSFLRFPVSCVLFAILVCHQSVAQDVVSRSNGGPAKTADVPVAKDADKMRRQRAVLLVKDFANRAFSFAIRPRKSIH